jgi:hypothetical protein
MAYSQYKNWIAKSTGLVPIEHILSIDIDEPQANEYRQLFTDSLIVQDNPSDGYVVGATNAAAKHAKGDILIYLSDDFDCPTQWDVLIRRKLTDGKEQLLKVDDCLQGFNVAVLTIPIMTRAFYDRFGYFFYPEYKSMFCDEDLYHVARIINGLVFAPDLKFPHLHPSNPTKELQGTSDATYNRSNGMWTQGQTLHNKRRLNNYGL